MRVFISYSGKDLDLVEQLADALDEVAEVDYWDQSRYLGEPDWDQIFEWIDEAHLVVVLITDKTVRRAMAVGQEVGHARALGKAIIPVVAKGVKSTDLGCLGGIAYQMFDKDDFEDAIQLVTEAVDDRRREKNQRNLIGAGILGTLAYLRFRKKPPAQPPGLL